jgi:asparagine synthase (glutamine-hydrolysing)
LILRGGVALGHRRLSIIDVDGSHQPMAGATGDQFVTFNGEILNYVELRRELDYPYRTSGDTETLLALFADEGPVGVQRLRGQFAYALYDESRDELWLFRDQLGILPLYYYVDDRRFLFASEIKGILAALDHTPSVDRLSLGDYLARRSIPAPWTLFKGIFKLPAGHMLRVGTHPDSIQATRYWSGHHSIESDMKSPIDGLRGQLRRAVTRNLVADVPVGAYLSGGIDSSLVVSLIRELKPDTPLHTFSASFGDPRHDESRFASLVAATKGTRHHHVAVGASDFIELWPYLSWHRDGPISEASDVAVFRLAQLASSHVKVVLSGEGSDELFGGYPKHRLAGLTARIGVLPSHIRGPVLRKTEQRLRRHLGRSRIALRALAERDVDDRMETWFAPFTRRERERLLGGAEEHCRKLSFPPRGDPLGCMLAADIDGWLVDNLLERGDRMTMAASLELRPPFLDLDLVEWALSVPSRFKIRNREGKWLVRQLGLTYLPEEIVRRRKIGFRVPLDRWFREDLAGVVQRALLGERSFVATELDRREVEKLVTRHLTGRANEELRVWTLLSLEVWHRVTYGGDLDELGLGSGRVDSTATI